MPGRTNRSKKQAQSSSEHKAFITVLKEVCPAHRIKDLDRLVTDLDGDEERIRQQIDEWWDEPAPVDEGSWENVNKRPAPAGKIHPKGGAGGGRCGRGPRGGGGERGHSGEGRGGRGRSSTGRGGGRGGRDGAGPRRQRDSDAAGGPTPVSSSRPGQGSAWGKVDDPELIVSSPPPPVAMVEITTLKMVPTPVSPPPAPVVTAPTTNVWATKGSAHLIRAEKPKPPQPASPKAVAPPAPPKDMSPILEEQQQHQPLTHLEPLVPPKVVETPEIPATHTIPVTHTTTNNNTNNSYVVEVPRAPSPPEQIPIAEPTTAWKPQPAPQPIPEPPVVTPPALPSPPASAQPIDIPPPSPVGTKAPIRAPVVEKPASPPPKPAAPPKPRANVLNMGHWETTADEDDNLDFEFGSFGATNVNNNDSTNSNGKQAAPEATAPSPARPPPGLSISGMPPMPANAMMAHELENKLEGVSLNAAAAAVEPVHIEPPPVPEPVTVIPPVNTTHFPNTPYNTAASAYGMYNYSGFGVPKQQQQQQQQHTQQLSYTGIPSAPSSGNNVIPTASTNTNVVDNSNNTIPPGMPNMYGNPAMYYNQQAFHMNHHQGYNYGYGAAAQFGGAAGFGWAGQNAGFYDDSAAAAAANVPGSYKPAGGYRGSGGGGGGGGRNQQNTYSQQQQQGNAPAFTPAYGPYAGMGYQDHHAYNQRAAAAGYGDPYMQQQQPQQQQQLSQQSAYPGFQDEGGVSAVDPRGNTGNKKRFPQQQQQQQHQPFGLQQQQQQPSTGWSHQGWSAPSWQGGGGGK